MHIRADLSQTAQLQPEEWDWVDSPQAGVRRVMLDRVGDEVAVATSLVRYAPESRFPSHGHARGEEFIVLLPDTNDRALPLAEDILQGVRDLNLPHARSRVDSRITISLGFGFAQAQQLESPQQLIIAADKALYHAKAAGRNCAAYAIAPALSEPGLLAP